MHVSTVKSKAEFRQVEVEILLGQSVKCSKYKSLCIANVIPPFSRFLITFYHFNSPIVRPLSDLTQRDNHILLFFDGHGHRSFGDMVMSNAEIFPKLLDKVGVVLFPEVHQFCAFKKLPMINKPLFIFFSILLLLVIIRFGTVFVKVIPCKSYSLSTTRPKIVI